MRCNDHKPSYGDPPFVMIALVAAGTLNCSPASIGQDEALSRTPSHAVPPRQAHVHGEILTLPAPLLLHTSGLP